MRISRLKFPIDAGPTVFRPVSGELLLIVSESGVEVHRQRNRSPWCRANREEPRSLEGRYSIELNSYEVTSLPQSLNGSKGRYGQGSFRASQANFGGAQEISPGGIFYFPRELSPKLYRVMATLLPPRDRLRRYRGEILIACQAGLHAR